MSGNSGNEQIRSEFHSVFGSSTATKAHALPIEPLQVHRPKMQSGPDVAFFQCLHELIATQSGFVDVQAYDEKMPGMAASDTAGPTKE